MGTFEKVMKFLREVRAEMRKVVWPTRDETIVSTIVALFAIGFVSLLFWVTDAALIEAVEYILRAF